MGTVSEFGLLLFHCSWNCWDTLLRSSDCHTEIRKSIGNVQSFCKGDIIYVGVARLERILGKICIPTQLRSMEPEDRIEWCLPNMGKDDPCNPRAIVSLASFEEPKLMSSAVTTSLVCGDFRIDNLASHSIGGWMISILVVNSNLPCIMDLRANTGWRFWSYWHSRGV